MRTRVVRYSGILWLILGCVGYANTTYFHELFVEPLPSQRKQTYRVDIAYANVGVVQRAIDSVMNVPLSIDPSQTMIVYQATPDEHDRIQALINQIDQPPKQVVFHVMIVEINTQHIETYQSIFSSLMDGIQVNYNYTDNQIVPADAIAGLIQASIQNGTATLVANPSIVGVHNQTAEFHVGDRIPYETVQYNGQTPINHIDYVQTGLEFSIHPLISENNPLMLTIDLSMSSVKLWQSMQSGRVPIIAKRQAHTQVVMQPDETLIMAGLLDNAQQVVTKRVPFLGRIPILGRLFRHKVSRNNQTDIVFVITPKII
jgi:general secretion pathway protein D